MNEALLRFTKAAVLQLGRSPLSPRTPEHCKKLSKPHSSITGYKPTFFSKYSTSTGQQNICSTVQNICSNRTLKIIPFLPMQYLRLFMVEEWVPVWRFHSTNIIILKFYSSISIEIYNNTKHTHIHIVHCDLSKRHIKEQRAQSIYISSSKNGYSDRCLAFGNLFVFVAMPLLHCVCFTSIACPLVSSYQYSCQRQDSPPCI